MRLSKLLDDGSGEVVAVELSEGLTPQALWVRYGPVYLGNGREGEPGVWISYQPAFMDSRAEGPVLLDPQTWRELNRAVRRQRRRAGKTMGIITKLEREIDVAFHNIGRHRRRRSPEGPAGETR